MTHCAMRRMHLEARVVLGDWEACDEGEACSVCSKCILFKVGDGRVYFVCTWVQVAIAGRTDGLSQLSSIRYICSMSWTLECRKERGAFKERKR